MTPKTPQAIIKLCALALVLTGIFAWSFSSFSFAQDAQQKGNVIRVKEGNTFMITLETGKSADFQWRINAARPLDESKLEFLRSRGGILMFKAIGAGKTAIYLTYGRVTPKAGPVLKKKKFIVIIS